MWPGANLISKLSRDDDLGDTVFGQELLVPGPGGKQAFNAAVGKCPLNRKLLCNLHVDIVAFGQVKSAMRCFFPLGSGVEESENLTTRIYGRPKVVDNRRDQLFRQVVQSRPKQDNVECASGKFKGLFKESLAVQDGLAVFIHSQLPIASAGIVDEVSHEDAVPQAGEIVDVGRRCVPHVDNAKTWAG